MPKAFEAQFMSQVIKHSLEVALKHVQNPYLCLTKQNKYPNFVKSFKNLINPKFMNTRSLLFLFVLVFIYACGTGEKKQTEEQVEASTTVSSELSLEDKITEIRTHFKDIESNLASYEKRSAFVDEGQWSPKEIAGFYHGKFPVKVSTTDLFGHGSTNTSYYLKGEKLFFVFETSTLEASVNGPFTNTETRTYIRDGKLIKALKKEKTFKDIEDNDMSAIKNVDITKTLDNPQKIVDAYTTLYKKSIDQLKETYGRFKDGRWISEEDPNSIIEIEGNKWIMSYKGQETTSNSIYDFTVGKKTHSDRDLLTLTNESDTLEYSILGYDGKTLSLSYLPRGNTLVYKKEDGQP